MNMFRSNLLLSSAIILVASQAYAQTVITSSTDLTPGMITPNNGQPALNAGAVGGLATSSLQPSGNTASSPITGPLFDQSQVNMTNGGLLFWAQPNMYNSGNHAYNGTPSPSADAEYMQPNVYGYSANGDLLHYWLNDNFADTGSAGAIASYFENLGPNASGNRTEVISDFIVASEPATANAYDAFAGHSHADAPMPALQSYGWPWAISGDSTNGGEVENLWVFNQHAAAAKGMYANYDAEFDMAYDSTSQVGENIGIEVVDQSASQDTANWNGEPGVYVNTAFALLGGPSQGFGCGFCVGKETGTWGLNGEGTILGAEVRQYGGPATQNGAINPAARFDIDYRRVAIAADGAAIQLPGFGVDANGGIGTGNLSLSGSIQGYASTLTGVTINYPGVYTSIPTFTVQAPPTNSGGTAATATASSVLVTAALNFGTTGSGYKMNDVITASIPNLVGTLPTFTVTTVDSNGGITGLKVSNAGAAVSAPANTSLPGIYGTTGGTGTGATLFLSWGFNTSISPAAFAVTGYHFAATGAGWAAGDTATIVGDTGTAGVYKVTAVTAQGGIEMPLTVSTVGSLTAVAGGTYHSLTASAKGTGGSIQVGYGIGSMSTTAGSGYAPGTQPLITGTQTNWTHAVLSARMNNSAAPFTINPMGGDVGINRPASVLSAQLDMNGSMSVGDDYSQRGTYGYKAHGYNVTTIPGTTYTATDSPYYNFIAGYNGIAKWDYAGNGLTTKEITTDVNNFNYGQYSTIFENYLDGSLQSRQVAHATTTGAMSRTLVAGDCGTVIRDTATTANTLTMPGVGIMPVGCTIDIVEVGAGGTITFATTSGVTLEQIGSGTLSHTTIGQFAKAQITVDSSSSFLLSGQVQ